MQHLPRRQGQLLKHAENGGLFESNKVYFTLKPPLSACMFEYIKGQSDGSVQTHAQVWLPLPLKEWYTGGNCLSQCGGYF